MEFVVISGFHHITLFFFILQSHQFIIPMSAQAKECMKLVKKHQARALIILSLRSPISYNPSNPPPPSPAQKLSHFQHFGMLY